MLRREGFTIFVNFGMELMSDDLSLVKLQFTDVFKRQVRDLAKRYRKIKLDIQPVLEQLQSGELIGDQVQKAGYTVFTALCAQTRTKRFFESVASQHFQKIFCGSFDR